MALPWQQPVEGPAGAGAQGPDEARKTGNGSPLDLSDHILPLLVVKGSVFHTELSGLEFCSFDRPGGVTSNMVLRQRIVSGQTELVPTVRITSGRKQNVVQMGILVNVQLVEFRTSDFNNQASLRQRVLAKGSLFSPLNC